MHIETTLHVNKNILDKLDNYTSLIAKSRTFIIKLLIQRMMKDHHKMISTNSRIKYQKRDLKENWKRINIVFNEYEYEYCQDLRKFLKMSISFILAYAVSKYLDEIIKRNKNPNNYIFHNYVFIKKSCDGTICWQIYWGIPPNLHCLF